MVKHLRFSLVKKTQCLRKTEEFDESENINMKRFDGLCMAVTFPRTSW